MSPSCQFHQFKYIWPSIHRFTENKYNNSPTHSSNCSTYGLGSHPPTRSASSIARCICNIPADSSRVVHRGQEQGRHCGMQTCRDGLLRRVGAGCGSQGTFRGVAAAFSLSSLLTPIFSGVRTGPRWASSSPLPPTCGCGLGAGCSSRWTVTGAASPIFSGVRGGGAAPAGRGCGGSRAQWGGRPCCDGGDEVVRRGQTEGGDFSTL